MTDARTDRLTPQLRCDRQPGTRWLSQRRIDTLQRHLRDLPELVALVESNPQPIRAGEPGPRPTPGSRPPLSLAAIQLADSRTRETDTDVIGTSDLDRRAGRRDGIAPTIRSWALMAQSEMLEDGHEHAPLGPQGIAGDVAWLLRHIVWIGEQQWVIELADVVRRMTRDAQAVLRIRPEYRPRCTSAGCRGILEAHTGWWSCPQCGRDYRDKRMVLVTQQPMTAEQIGDAFGIKPATIRKWRERGHLQPAEDGRHPRYDLLDVLRLHDTQGRKAPPEDSAC